MAHFTHEVEVVIPAGVEVVKVVGSKDGTYAGSKLLMRSHSDTSLAAAKALGDDLGDNIKTANA